MSKNAIELDLSKVAADLIKWSTVGAVSAFAQILDPAIDPVKAMEDAAVTDAVYRALEMSQKMFQKITSTPPSFKHSLFKR